MKARAIGKQLVRFVFAQPNFIGLVSGALWFCTSLTPSLLPRPWLLQGVVTGIAFAVGYGVGVACSWIARKIVHWQPSVSVRRAAWLALGAAGGGGIAVTMVLFSLRWQNDVRALVGQPPVASGHRVLVFIIAVVLAAGLILTCRGIYWLICWTDRRLRHWIPRRFSGAIAAVLVLLLLYTLFNGVALRSFVRFANTTYRAANDTTPAGITQPTSSLRSGSRASLITWQSLGKQGRRFTGSGPSLRQLQALNGQAAASPIRIYAGLESASTVQDRVMLAMRELDRTAAWDRPVLVVATPTGTGWVNPQSIDALEYMWNGNTAAVAVQYSYLPSWISFIVDKQNATDAGRELFNRVYEKWSSLPADHRPKLIAYGLSLGSYGAQAAFSGQDDLRNRVDGALFMGTPNDSLLWRDLERHRDAGSPARLPVYRSGQTIRFAAQASDLARPAGPWVAPRVLYLQHASDPVVWWSPDLLFKKPAWLAEQRGPDVSRAMQWYPLSTFLQVTVDQFVGASAPDGHGHNYSTITVDAWSAIVPPPTWTTERTTKLRAIIATYADN